MDSILLGIYITRQVLIYSDGHLLHSKAMDWPSVMEIAMLVPEGQNSDVCRLLTDLQRAEALSTGSFWVRN